MTNITITLTADQIQELTYALDDRLQNIEECRVYNSLSVTNQSIAFAKRLQNKLYGAINKKALDTLIK